MPRIRQMIGIHSQMAEEIYRFYLDQEAKHEDAPLAPWRNGVKLKASDFYVEMQLFTDQMSFRKKPSTPKPPSNNAKSFASRIHFGKLTKPIVKFTKPIAKRIFGLRKERDELRPENSTKENPGQKESWKEVFAGEGQRIIFKGAAGSGKSFSLGQEIRQRSVKARAELENFRCSLFDLEIPIFVKASVLVSSNQGNIEDTILDSLFTTQKAISPELNRWIRDAFRTDRGKRLFIVVDGLDELPESSLSLFRELTQQLDKLKSANLVISCRTMYFDERRDWINWTGQQKSKVVELAPLEEAQQLGLIEKLIEDGDLSKQTLMELLKKNYSLNHFCRTAFILTSTCLLYSEGWLSDKATYASLYKALTEKVLRGEWKDWKDLTQRPEWMKKSEVLRDAAQDDRIKMLSQISWFLFESSPSENRFTREQWLKAHKKAAEKGLAKHPSPTRFLDELVLVGMVIVAGYDSRRNKCYSFAHRTILEYFAACGLVGHHSEEVWTKTLVKHIWCESDWIEVIRFAASLTGNPTLLLRSVAKDVGYDSPQKKPLQRLSGFARKLAGLIIVFLISFVVISFFAVENSESARNQVDQYISNRQPYYDNVKSLWESSKESLVLLEYETKDHESYREIAETYGSRGLNESFKYYYVIKDEIKSSYNFLFRLLQREAQQYRDNAFSFVWKFLLAHTHSLIPLLIIAVPGLRISARLIDWSNRKLFYWIYKERKDDIFLTGIQMQAEIVGHNNNVAEQEVERVVKELLNVKNSKHGAMEIEHISEDLWLLVGSNSYARQLLNEHWSSLVGKRLRVLEWLNWTYEKITSAHGQLLYLERRKSISPVFCEADFLKVRQLTDKLLDSSAYGWNGDEQDARLVHRYIRSKLSSDTEKLLENIYSGQYLKKLRRALTAEFNAILHDPFLYCPERFEKIDLRTETSDLLERKPTGEEIMRLNRLLLEDVYKTEIRKTPDSKRLAGLRLYFIVWVICAVFFLKWRKKDIAPRFNAASFKKLNQFAEKLVYDRNPNTVPKKESISEYVFGKFSPDARKLSRQFSKETTNCIFIRLAYRRLRGRYRRFPYGLFRKFSKLRREKFGNALAKNFNRILRDTAMTDDERFERITLRTETKTLLKHNPTGTELMYLNRLLLEDAYPENLIKMQEKWLRFVSWLGKHLIINRLFSQMTERRYLTTTSELSRAFRGLSLLLDRKNVKLLEDLLDQCSIIGKHLVENERSKSTFTQLDIVVAKTLTILGDSRGKEKLIDIAGRIDEGNKYTPLAIKELSLFDGKRAIELAAVCLKDNWQDNSDYRYHRSKEFQDILLALPFEQVTGELARIMEETGEEKYYNSVLSPFLQEFGEEAKRKWLEKAAKNDARKFVADLARKKVDTSDSDNGSDNLMSRIKEHVEKENFGDAIEYFNQLISPGDSKRYAEEFVENAEKIAAFCDTEMLERWAIRYRDQTETYKNLILLAGQPGGKNVRNFLFRLANDLDFDHYYNEWRYDLWLALGDMDDPAAEATLIRILNNYRRISQSIKSFFNGVYRRHDVVGYLVGGLEKIDSDEALRQVITEINPNNWIAYHLAARLLAERDDPTALLLLLLGESERQSGEWNDKFGNEPKLRDFAQQFGARIITTDIRGFKEYIAVSKTRNFTFRATNHRNKTMWKKLKYHASKVMSETTKIRWLEK